MGATSTALASMAVAFWILAVAVNRFVEYFRSENRENRDILVRASALAFLPPMLQRALSLLGQLEGLIVDDRRPLEGTLADASSVLAGKMSSDEFRKRLEPKIKNSPLAKSHIDHVIDVLQSAGETFQQQEAIKGAYETAVDDGSSSFKQLLFGGFLAGIGWATAFIPAFTGGGLSFMLDDLQAAFLFLAGGAFFLAAMNAKSAWEARQQFVKLADKDGITVPPAQLGGPG